MECVLFTLLFFIINPADFTRLHYVDSPNVGSTLSETRIAALETLASEAAMSIY